MEEGKIACCCTGLHDSCRELSIVWILNLISTSWVMTRGRDKWKLTKTFGVIWASIFQHKSYMIPPHRFIYSKLPNSRKAYGKAIHTYVYIFIKCIVNDRTWSGTRHFFLSTNYTFKTLYRFASIQLFVGFALSGLDPPQEPDKLRHVACCDWIGCRSGYPTEHKDSWFVTRVKGWATRGS